MVCLPQILLGPFLNTLTHIKPPQNSIDALVFWFSGQKRVKVAVQIDQYTLKKLICSKVSIINKFQNYTNIYYKVCE